MKNLSLRNIVGSSLLALLCSCSADVVESTSDDITQLTPSTESVVALSSVKIAGEESKTLTISKSRTLAQTQMVEGFVADDIIRLDIKFSDGNCGVYTYQYTTSQVWQFLGDDMLFVSNLEDVTSVVAHFIPGVGADDTYGWLSSSTPWDGTGAYPDILVDKDVDIESDGLSIDFSHAVNGRLLVTLAATNSEKQSLLSSAKVEMLSSMAMSYYTITEGVGSYSYDFFASRELDRVESLDGDNYQLLLTDIPSYNMVFNIEVEGVSYRATVYRVDIAADYSATVTINVDIQ